MKIAIDVRSLMEGRHSGVEEYTTQLIRALIRVAPQHTYHLFYNSFRPVTLPDFGKGRVVMHGFRYPNKLFNILQLVFRYPKWDELLEQHVDVVLVPSARLMPLSEHVPMVAVMHDLSYERFPEFLSVWKRIWHRLTKPRKLMQQASHIISDSFHTKQDLVSLYGIDKQKISVVYPGVPQTAQFRPSNIHKVKISYNLPERYVLSFGTIEPRKNIVSIIEAWSAIASMVPHNLVIAGDKSWRQKEVEAAIARSPYKDRIHMVGFVQEKDKASVYAGADVFVYPSFYEGFGFPPLESLLAGTPVITSFNSALPEVVGKWATLVDPYNPSQLAAVMREALLRPSRVPGHVAQEIVQTYSWDKAAKETLAIVKQV